jgi:serine/threonine protein kinase
MRRIWGLLLLVFMPTSVYAGGITEWAPYNRSQIGVMDLPTIEPAKLPPHCKSFDHICALEAQRRYSEAFERYEERYEACGDWGWTLEGDSHGLDAAVAFKTTPCGTKVVVKASRSERTIEHIQKECLTLQRLDDGSCEGCFPKYYFYSNRSRACYSELLKHSNITFGLIVRAARFGNHLPIVKKLIHQGIVAIQALRAHHIEHRDLSFRNLILARDTTASDHMRVKVIDFGASAPVGSPLPPPKQMAGNLGRSDLYTLFCNFARHIYPDIGNCRQDRKRVPPREDVLTLKWVLLKVMNDNWESPEPPDLASADSLIRDVVHY